MCFPERPNDFWSVRGAWQLAAPKNAASGFNDIVIAFDGQSSSPPEDEQGKPNGPRVTVKINGNARYAYDPAMRFYRLVEGKNVVPVPEMDG